MTTTSAIPAVLSAETREAVGKSNVLVVGAGGIGCEILKNLALSGFQNIEIIDLDTIDVSNLNRQFLFRKEHVGKPKAVVAKETVLCYNPNLNITAYHDSITTQDYGVNFYKKFDLVLNALDNRVARNHVNRMCLAADIPLIESGTSGYSGQVEFIKKGLTQCYECQPKPPQRTYPGCTIRNTPSEPVHCIVWAKHLFNQLFGEADPDQDVSPDTADPELRGLAVVGKPHSHGIIKRKSTNLWAKDINYDSEKLFNKFFQDDIEYLLSMENLWKKRKPPKPISWAEALWHTSAATEPKENDRKADNMQVWSLKKCADLFASSIRQLTAELHNKSFLVWDKDDKPAMDFVTACANVRAHIFDIEPKSRFQIKSIAGNIVPAIATANAIVAGLVVLLAFRILGQEYEKCYTTYVRQKSHLTKTVLITETVLSKANPNCYVCAEKPSVNVSVNVGEMTVKEFETEILKKSLNMIAPDALIEGKNVVIISSEEGETEANNDKKLCEFGIVDGTILKVDDFLQNYELTVYISHYKAKDSTKPPYIVNKGEDIKPAANGVSKTKNKDPPTVKLDDDGADAIEAQKDEDDPQEGSSTKRRRLNPAEEDDDLVMLDE